MFAKVDRYYILAVAGVRSFYKIGQYKNIENSNALCLVNMDLRGRPRLQKCLFSPFPISTHTQVTSGSNYML